MDLQTTDSLLGLPATCVQRDDLTWKCGTAPLSSGSQYMGAAFERAAENALGGKFSRRTRETVLVGDCTSDEGVIDQCVATVGTGRYPEHVPLELNPLDFVPN